MSIVSEDKQKLIGRFQRHHKDTGSSELQVAILTERIRNLTDHFKAHPKDNHSRRGLILMVSQRKRLLSYMRRNDFERYTKILQELELRK